MFARVVRGCDNNPRCRECGSVRSHAVSDAPPYRYVARRANESETKWQDRWEDERVFWTPNPSGLLSEEHAERAELPKLYVLDMFPYPSGAGLHVGHPLGYIGTDVYARFQRMSGFNVLHAMGYDGSASRPSSSRCRRVSTRGSRPTRTSPTCAVSSGRWASATIQDAGSQRPTSPTTAGRNGSSSRSSRAGGTTTSTRPVRSPSSSPS